MKHLFLFKVHLITYIFIIFLSLLKPGCYSEELETETNLKIGSGNDIVNNVKTLKKKIKEAGIEKPEDIPEVKDWIERCKETVGGRTWRVIRKSPSRIADCVAKHINYEKLKIEVNDSMARGELDLVFKKYCGRRDEIVQCLDDTIDLIQPCLNSTEKEALNITLEALDAAIDFTCHENGDRIAIFMAENGVQCLTNSSEPIKKCIKTNLPEFGEVENDPESMKIDQFLISEEQCGRIRTAHDCVVKETTTCDDPTPSNVLDSLIKAALKVTPCDLTKPQVQSTASAFYVHFASVFPHVLLIIFAGLTAANILL